MLTACSAQPQHPSFVVVQHWPYRAPLQGCPRASVKIPTPSCYSQVLTPTIPDSQAPKWSSITVVSCASPALTSAVPSTHPIPAPDRRLDRHDQPRRHHLVGSADRDLQPCRPVARQGLVRHGRVHRRSARKFRLHWSTYLIITLYATRAMSTVSAPSVFSTLSAPAASPTTFASTRCVDLRDPDES